MGTETDSAFAARIVAIIGRRPNRLPTSAEQPTLHEGEGRHRGQLQSDRDRDPGPMGMAQPTQ